MPNIAAWGNALLSNTKQPNFTWTIDSVDGHITVYNDPSIMRPINVTMFYAASYPRHGLRDWRLAGGNDPTLPQLVLWAKTPLNETAPNSNMWIASQKMPEQGWMGFFVEVFYKGVPPFYDPTRNTEYRMTTQTSYIPVNVWPFPDCYAEGCYGTLV